MAKNPPGLITNFNGLWVRDSPDGCPPDHFADCLNTIYGTSGVGTRDGLYNYNGIDNIVRMALYKPLPPFTGTNVPRIIALDSTGHLFDILLSTTVPIYTNSDMKDFGFVNFFGRCYISPSDGKVGLTGVHIQVYDGSGNPTRDAAGPPPTDVMVAVLDTGSDGKLNYNFGTFLLSYALETASGFITQPAPFTYVDAIGGGKINITTLPLGPAGTVARWIITTNAIIRADLSVPPDVGTASFLPTWLIARVPNNTDTSYTGLEFYDSELINDASYLLTQLQTLPAGVGLIDYKGRMVSYGEFADPSLVRVSEIGQPEAFSATSGFIITDPSDSTGVRSATEFRDTLYFFKQQRGYQTQDNTLEASTWILTNFDKSIGTEQYGIAAVLDAKGASSDGFILADRGALYYFNGVFVEPELSYKIRDLWLRINQANFYKVQVSLDPINKRIYILAPLDDSTIVSHIIFGDYRNGLDPLSIKWSLWTIEIGVSSVLTYTDFTSNIPSLVTRMSTSTKIIGLNIGVPSLDVDVATDSYFELPVIRFGTGLSQFTRLRVRGQGPCNLSFTAYGEDKQSFVNPQTLNIPSSLPGREYAQLMNLVSEQCSMKIRCANLNENYKVFALQLEGFQYSDERPR